ncbi:hypothetical protein FKP32DRAFT_752876 [Trametes sanguinea]|nr:hypothetical protein FKP32DRAFT_752876 [Trametes sanguinea]
MYIASVLLMDFLFAPLVYLLIITFVTFVTSGPLGVEGFCIISMRAQRRCIIPEPPRMVFAQSCKRSMSRGRVRNTVDSKR